MVKFKLINKLMSSSSKSSSNPTPSVGSASIIKQSNDEPMSLSESKSDNKTTSHLLNILIEDFSCYCCFQILKRPVTLECGHSFCQLCLAQFYLNNYYSKKCPSCSLEWKTMPSINHNLQSSIEKLVQLERMNRDTLLPDTSISDYLGSLSEPLDAEECQMLSKFEEKYKSSTMNGMNLNSLFQSFTAFNAANSNVDLNNNNNPTGSTLNLNEAQRLRPAQFRPFQLNNLNMLIIDVIASIFRRIIELMISTILQAFLCLMYGLLAGAFLGLVLVSIGWAYTSMDFMGLSSSTDSISLMRNKFYKPVDKWSVEDTQEWLFQLGPWTNELADVTLVHNISGPSLLNLNETTLSLKPFYIQSRRVRRLFVDSVRVLKNHTEHFVDFWQHKNSNRLEVVFFMLFVDAFPRLTLSYHYFTNTRNFSQWAFKFSEIESPASASSTIPVDNTEFIYYENLKRLIVSDYSPIVMLKSDEVNTEYCLFDLLKLPYIRFKNLFNTFFYVTNPITAIIVSFNCYILTISDLVVALDWCRSLTLLDTERLGFLVNDQGWRTVHRFSLLIIYYSMLHIMPDILVDTIFFYFFYSKILFNIYEMIHYLKNFYSTISHHFVR